MILRPSALIAKLPDAFFIYHDIHFYNPTSSG